MFRLNILLILLFAGKVVHAQIQIRGEVREAVTGDMLSDVNVKNIFSGKGMTVQSDGHFTIPVQKGDLVEFSKIGYQTRRLRIQSEKEPLYYVIQMEKAPVMLRAVDIRGKPLDFVKDSIRYREAYNWVLRKERKEDLDMRSMPLAMLSKKNRQEWAFRDMYEEWEKQKFIDFVFNEKLVARITYLQGEELKRFMTQYRPGYEFLRDASQYEYLSFIKSAYQQFKNTTP